MARRPKTETPCVYCDVRPAMTRDHVVPKCLFPGPLPVDMVTVPVCRECNEEKARDDDYLRDWLVIDIENSAHPAVQQLLPDKVARSARTNRSLVARDIRSKSEIRPMVTMGGLFLGEYPAIPIDADRMNRQFARITRGLYFRLYKRRLPADCRFRVLRVDPFRKDAAIQVMRDLGRNTCHRLGDNIFACMHAYAAEDPSVTHWLLCFYNIHITVWTNLPEDVDQPA